MLIRNQFHPGPRPGDTPPPRQTIWPEGSILLEIADFQARTGMADSTLGRYANNDWDMVNRIRAGCKPRAGTLAKLRAFMRGGA